VGFTPHLGGSNGRGFAVVRGYEDDPRLVHDEPRYDGTPAPSAPGVCAGGPRALLDFSRPQAASERATAASWHLWQRLSGVHPPALPLKVFVERWRNDPDAFPGGPRDDGMVAAYRAQPLIKAYLDHPWSLGLGFPGSPFHTEHPVIGFSRSRADYVRATSVSSPGRFRRTRTCSRSTAGGERATEVPFTRPATRNRVLTTPQGPLYGRAARPTCRSCPSPRFWYGCTATTDAPTKVVPEPENGSRLSMSSEGTLLAARPMFTSSGGTR
jgi:hypothetical protein